MQNAGSPLRDRREHRHHVHDLVRFFVQPLRGALPGQHQHGSPIHVGISHAGDEIGRPRPQRAQTACRIPRETPVNLGHEGRPLLVPGENEPDLVGLRQRHDEIRVLLPRHAEDVLDAFFFQTFDK